MRRQSIELLRIKEPVWLGRKFRECVGVANFRLRKDVVVEVLFKDRFGNRVFPGAFVLLREDVPKFRVREQVVRRGVKLTWFPLAKLKHFPDVEEAIRWLENLRS